MTVRDRTIAVVGETLLVTLLATGVAMGQAPEPDDDDLVWSFAPKIPFVDSRVQLAFAILIDEEQVVARAGIGAQHRLLPSEREIREGALGADLEDAQLLLQASGNAPSLLAETRRCAIAVLPPGPSSQAPDFETRIAVADSFAVELQTALGELGIAAQRCGLEDDPESTDILIWGTQDPAPMLDPNFDPNASFLGAASGGGGGDGRDIGSPDNGPAVGRQGGPGEGPAALPNTGSGGLVSSSAPWHEGVWAPGVALVAAFLVLLAAARARARR